MPSFSSGCALSLRSRTGSAANTGAKNLKCIRISSLARPMTSPARAEIVSLRESCALFLPLSSAISPPPLSHICHLPCHFVHGFRPVSLGYAFPPCLLGLYISVLSCWICVSATSSFKPFSSFPFSSCSLCYIRPRKKSMEYSLAAVLSAPS